MPLLGPTSPVCYGSCVIERMLAPATRAEVDKMLDELDCSGSYARRSLTYVAARRCGAAGSGGRRGGRGVRDGIRA